MSRYCQHPAVEVVEVGPLQGSYVAYCPDCNATSGEAVTVDRALTDFHACWGADFEEVTDPPTGNYYGYTSPYIPPGGEE